ncbi:MAG: C40 family peptidase [Gammaproteobacteria bacterium]|nr:C40 family peptidase [Gammaproteobacteria bacterium]
MRFSDFIALSLVATLALLTGCAGAPARPNAVAASAPPAPAQRLDRGVRAALIAREQIGVSYRYGGMSPATGFDCSGLVYYSYAEAGVPVPRTSTDQFRAARKISLADAEPGDVVFFQDQEKLSHVGIYLGQGRFIHAPSSGRTVSVASIDSPYYQEHLVAVGRLTLH